MLIILMSPSVLVWARVSLSQNRLALVCLTCTARRECTVLKCPWAIIASDRARLVLGPIVNHGRNECPSELFGPAPIGIPGWLNFSLGSDCSCTSLDHIPTLPPQASAWQRMTDGRSIQSPATSISSRNSNSHSIRKASKTS